MACECSPKPCKFLRATLRDPCRSPKYGLQRSGKALLLLQTLAGLVTHKHWVPKTMYSRGEKEGKWYWADSFKRAPFASIDAVSSINPLSSVRLSFQPLNWKQPANFRLTFNYFQNTVLIAKDPRNSAMSSNYVKPLGTSKAYNAVTLQLIPA